MNLDQFKILDEELKTSGLSVKAFMTSKGLPIHLYYYWSRKSEEHSSDESSKDKFIKITQPLKPGSMVVRFPNGVEINFGEIPSIGYIQSLIK